MPEQQQNKSSSTATTQPATSSNNNVNHHQSADDFVDSVSAAMPPSMEQNRAKNVDELLKEMNRVPLFMTELDETDGEGGENVMLEAIKALAYEGTKAEVAANFREQGNEAARAKLWQDAREFYSKAVLTLQGKMKLTEAEEDPSIKVTEIEDEEAEATIERELEEACLANRALCNLEMSITAFCQETDTTPLPTNHFPIRRKLRSMQQRLRSSPTPQPTQRQSLVSRRRRLSRPRQAPLSPRCLHLRPSIRREQRCPPNLASPYPETSGYPHYSRARPQSTRRTSAKISGRPPARAQSTKYLDPRDGQPARDGRRHHHSSE